MDPYNLPWNRQIYLTIGFISTFKIKFTKIKTLNVHICILFTSCCKDYTMIKIQFAGTKSVIGCDLSFAFLLSHILNNYIFINWRDPSSEPGLFEKK